MTENGVAFSHIIQHRIQPRIAVSEGRLGSGHAEDVAGYHASVTQRFFQAVQQRPVAAESRRLLQTRQVEGLAGAGHGDGAHARFHGQIQRRDEHARPIDKVLMDFVGYKQYVIPGQHGKQRLEFLPAPHTSHGIMRAAQEHHARARAAGILHTLQVHGVAARVVVPERTLRHFAAVVARGRVKRSIYRRLHDDAVARPRKGLYRRLQPGNHTGQHNLFRGGQPEPMAALHEIQHRC